MTSIGAGTFSGCSGLTSVTIPSNVTSIGAGAFSGCSGLTSVTIPSSVTSIGTNAFSGCSGLTSVTIDCANIGSWFREIKSIAEVILGNNVISIGQNAFSGCSGLTSVTIPSSVTSIGDAAFWGCKGISSVTIPSNATFIGEGAFSNCSGLTSIIVEAGNPNYDSRDNSNAIIETSSNTLIAGCMNTIIPSSITSIGYGAFYGCSGLISITIPENMNSIGAGAFYGCSGLISINIPAGVTSVGEGAFSGCYRLSTIYCLNPIPPTCFGLSTFRCNTDYVRDQYDIYNYATLHVPMGSKEDYSSAYEWRYFNKIKEDMQMDGNVYYANLVVQQGADGYTRQAVKTDEQFTIFIGSYGINRINTVTFNGEDVTSDVVNGYYTTPEIKGESVLSISYEIDDAVNSPSLKDVKVSGYDGEIRISNINEPSDVYIYSTDGKLVGNANAALGSACLQVQGEQLYLVKVGNRTYKVTMP